MMINKILWVIALVIGLNSFAWSQTEPQVGDKVEVNWLGKGTYYSGKIDQVDGEKYFIKYDDGDEEWTTVDRIKLVVAGAFNIGDRVEANWKGEGVYKPAIIKNIKDQSIYLKYDDGNYEWSNEASIRPMEGSKCADKTSKYDKGEQVDLLYNNKWYDATILEVKGDGEYKVHYDGWDSKWDEYVCNDRLQARTEKTESTGPKGNTGGTVATTTPTVGKIRLRNNCSKDVVMRVGDKDYTVSKYKYIDIEVTKQCWISTLINGTPTGKQLYFLETGLAEFYADCR